MKVRRAARGLCLWKIEIGWRSSRAARSSPDGVRIRQAAPCTPGNVSPSGLLRPRSGQTAGDGFRGPARTLKEQIPHVRHRPVPVCRPTRLAAYVERGPGPVAGFARRSRENTARQRSHDGIRLLSRPAARYGTPQKAFLPPGRKRSRTIRQRERDEYGMGAEGVDKSGWIRHDGRACASRKTYPLFVFPDESPALAEASAAGSRIRSGMMEEMRGPQSPSLRGRLVQAAGLVSASGTSQQEL